MDGLTFLLVVLASGSIGLSIYFFQKINTLKKSAPKALTELEAIEKASKIAKEKIIEAEQRANNIERAAQSNSDKARNKLREKEKELYKTEEKLVERSKEIERKIDSIDKKEKEIEEIRNSIKNSHEDLKKEIELVASMSEEEARQILEKRVEKDLTNWIAKQVKDAEVELKEKKTEKVQEILSSALLNASVEFTSETTTTTVDIGDESMKGRIIGKEGRNIRTFQDRTGVDLIMDESPTQVTISSFDPIRREVGALALKRLIKEGKIHPASIEETIEKVKKELLKEIRKTGDKLAYDAGFNNLPQEIISLLGRFKYRYSKGQNLIKHTLEVVNLSEALAKQMGVRADKVKLAALLHDIGKVAPEEGKQYFEVSAELVEKYVKDMDVVETIKALDPDMNNDKVEGEILRVADAISTSRPGAQKSTYDEYIKRLRVVEDAATKYEGVSQTYALRAGKELKVIVEPKKITSEEAKVLAFNIAQDIEKSQHYNGPVKVTVIREYRAEATAK